MPPDPGCTPRTWYRDRDGDGFGGSESRASCDQPNDEYVEKTGDCNDDNPSVFPGQTQHFTVSFQNAQGRASYDYDCDGQEEQQPQPPRTRGGQCVLAGSGQCAGDGFIPLVARQAASGVDLVCGPVKKRVCNFAVGPGGAACTPLDTPAESTPCR